MSSLELYSTVNSRKTVTESVANAKTVVVGGSKGYDPFYLIRYSCARDGDLASVTIRQYKIERYAPYKLMDGHGHWVPWRSPMMPD
jgi:hypothetical protein